MIEALHTPWLPFDNVPAPLSQNLDNLGGDSRCQRHTDENQTLVDGVCEGKLGPEACI